jgi:hypothetical protein
MLNWLGADRSTVEFVVDRNVHKQGLWVPGARIPILEPGQLAQRRPEYAIILPWNFADEIVAQQRGYLEAGGAFIVPVPAPRIIRTGGGGAP